MGKRSKRSRERAKIDERDEETARARMEVDETEHMKLQEHIRRERMPGSFPSASDAEESDDHCETAAPRAKKLKSMYLQSTFLMYHRTALIVFSYLFESDQNVKTKSAFAPSKTWRSPTPHDDLFGAKTRLRSTQGSRCSRSAQSCPFAVGDSIISQPTSPHILYVEQRPSS